TAELHLALASDPGDPAFAPERISPQDQRSIYQSLNGLAMRSLELLRGQLNRLPDDAKDEARPVLELEARIAQALRAFLARRLESWARFWVDSVSAAFLRSYLTTAGTASFVPQTTEDLDLQLSTMLLEKALYELRYELNSRPEWVRIPLRGILEVVNPG